MDYNISPRNIMELAAPLREEIQAAAAQAAAGHMICVRAVEQGGYEMIQQIITYPAEEAIGYMQANPSSDWVYYWPEEFLA